MIKETIINSVLAASVAGGGVGMKYYADHTYMSMNAYQQQSYESDLTDYRRDINQLSREKLRASTPQEKALIQQQIEETERERRDFVEKFKK